MKEYFASNDILALDIVARLKRSYPESYFYIVRDGRYTFCPFAYKCCSRKGQVIAIVYFRRFFDESMSNEYDSMTSVDDPFEELPF